MNFELPIMNFEFWIMNSELWITNYELWILNYELIKHYELNQSLNSKISPGWQSSTLQIASSVEKRTAFALPVFSTDKFACVMPIFSANSPDDILRRAIITSKFTIIMITIVFDCEKVYNKCS